MLQHPVWLKAFETLIEGRAVRPYGRLHFVGNCVEGEAKEVVDSFLLLDSEVAYDKAKEKLKKRFGNPFAVAATCRKKLESWPKIHPNDITAFEKVFRFLSPMSEVNGEDRTMTMKAVNSFQSCRNGLAIAGADLQLTGKRKTKSSLPSRNL